MNGERQTVRTCRDCSESHRKWLLDLRQMHRRMKHARRAQSSVWDDWKKEKRLPHLVSWAELVNGKDLRRVQSFAENINGSQLTTKHSVSVGRLGGTQETLVIALPGKMREKTEKERFHNKCTIKTRCVESMKQKKTFIRTATQNPEKVKPARIPADLRYDWTTARPAIN